MSSSLKQLLKRTLDKIAPGPAAEWESARHREHMRRFEEAEGLPRITNAFIEKHGAAKVLRGPFEGMAYIPYATGSMLLPKLIGSYEEEIEADLEALIAAQPDVVVDIGCAEGYYAVGVARRVPGAKVFAFDTNPYARKLCAEMATLNGVADRVTVGGTCDFATLESSLKDRRGLVICDCDGCEGFLLDPARAPSLRRSDLLVELHDYLDSSLSPTILSRFGETHDIKLTGTAAARDPERYPAIAFLTEDERKKAVCEYRPAPQQWAIMRAKPQQR